MTLKESWSLLQQDPENTLSHSYPFEFSLYGINFFDTGRNNVIFLVT